MIPGPLSQAGIQPPLSINGIKGEVENRHPFVYNQTTDLGGDYDDFVSDDGTPFSARTPGQDPVMVEAGVAAVLLIFTIVGGLSGESGFANYAAQSGFEYIGNNCEPCSTEFQSQTIVDKADIAYEFGLISSNIDDFATLKVLRQK